MQAGCCQPLKLQVPIRSDLVAAAVFDGQSIPQTTPTHQAFGVFMLIKAFTYGALYVCFTEL